MNSMQNGCLYYFGCRSQYTNIYIDYDTQNMDFYKCDIKTLYRLHHKDKVEYVHMCRYIDMNDYRLKILK